MIVMSVLMSASISSSLRMGNRLRDLLPPPLGDLSKSLGQTGCCFGEEKPTTGGNQLGFLASLKEDVVLIVKLGKAWLQVKVFLPKMHVQRCTGYANPARPTRTLQ